MDSHSPSVLRHEYTLSVENTTLRVMIDPEVQPYEDEEVAMLRTHTHTYAEIFACEEGSLTLLTEADPIHLMTGDVALVPAKFHHVCVPSPGCVWRSVGVLPVRRHSRGCQNLYRNLATLCLSDTPIVRRGTPDFCTVICRHEDTYSSHGVSCAALEILRILLLLTKTDDVPHNVSRDASYYGGELKRIAHLEEIVETRYAQPLTNEAIAAMLYISPRQLTRIVKQRYGTTLHAVITKRRVEAAHSMLTHTDLPVEQICAIVGFHSKSCFYSAFYKENGITPYEYRKSLGKRRK